MGEKRTRSYTLTWLLGIPTVILLGLNLPEFSGTTFILWVLFTTVVAFTLNQGLAFSEGEISAAYSVGIMSYFTLVESEDLSLALWAVALGSVSGIFIRQGQRLRWQNWDTIIRMTWEPAFRTAGHLTLGLAVGAWFYQLLDGRLPLATFTFEDALPTLALITAYLAVYLAIVIIKMRWLGSDFEETMRLNWQSLLVILLLPLPLALLGAVAYHSISYLSFGLLLIGLLIAVIGAHGFSVTQDRYRQRVRELSTLTTISNALQTNLDPKTLLHTIYQHISPLLNINNFIVVIQHPVTHMLSFPFTVESGEIKSLPDRSPENGLLEQVMKTKAPLLASRNSAASLEKLGAVTLPRHIASWLGVPLLSADRVSGAIAIYSETDQRQFNKIDQRLLLAIAMQTGIALDNAKLYKQADDRVRQLRALTEASTSISKTLDFAEVLKSICTLAEKVVSADASGVYIWLDAAKKNLTLSSSNGLSHHFVANPPTPLLVNEPDFNTREQPLVIADGREDKRATALISLFDQENKRAWVEMLMRDGEEMLGILVVYFTAPHQFSHEDSEVLRTFASQAALAIRNSQRYGRADAALSRRLEQMYTLQQLSYDLYGTRVTLEQVFEKVLRRSIEGTGAHAAHFSLRVDGESARCVHAIGYSAEDLAKIDPLAGVTRHIFKAGDTTLITDVVEERAYRPVRAATRAHLRAPILRELEIMGIITLESDNSETFVQEDKYFLMQVGALAKGAIENYNLVTGIETTRDRLQVILDSMTEAVLLIDAAGLIRLASPRTKMLLGLLPSEISEQPIQSLVQKPELRFAEKLGFEPNTLLGLAQALAGGNWTPEEKRTGFEIKSNGKQRFVSRFDTGVKGHDNKTIGWLMVFSDVTEERELAQAREDLSSMIIHDLRGPLTAINAGLKLIKSTVKDGDTVADVVHRASDSAGRSARKLLHLVNSLLDISKMESGMMVIERKPSNVRQITENVVKELEPLALEMEVKINNELGEDTPLLDIDAEKVERVLLNLMDNAIKFTPGNGYISIAAHLEQETNGSSTRFMRIKVIDTGPGVPDEHKRRLFDRYVQIKGQQGRRRGTGLGLAFCRLAVEAHGGKIWIEDNPHGGSIFAFTLPIAPETP